MQNSNSMMKKFFLVAVSLLFIVACSKDDNPVDSGYKPPGDNLDAFEQNKLLGRGINLGNALEALNEGDWGVTLQSEYFQLISDVGFNSVRIPIKWSAHALEISPYTIQESFFDRIDWAIESVLNKNMAVVINIHHYDEIMNDPNGHKERFLAIWKQISERYKSYPKELFFEILNEPHSNLTASLWNQFLAEAVTEIRKENPYRTLIIGLAEWGGPGALNNLRLPENENNIIVSFHYYNPFHFTHQGAEWVDGSNAWLGTKWSNTNSERNEIQNEFDGIVAWAGVRNVPLNLGEFGVYSTADMQSRILWTAFVSQHATLYGISWHYWEFCAGFGVYDLQTNSWREGLLDALLPPLPKIAGEIFYGSQN